MNYFVTAIGTGSGKSVTSAIMAQALQADYWKPVQAGYPTDTDTVRNLVDNPKSIFHNEAFVLKAAESPHSASKKENIKIKLNELIIPSTDNTLVVEGVGGVLVPLNDREFIIDLVPRVESEVILVADLYLGCINHTLLTLELLRERNYRVKGIIFNGENSPETERIIMEHTNIPCLLKIRPQEVINERIINHYAIEFLKNWDEKLEY